MPILSSGAYASREECEARIGVRASIAKNIIRLAAERGTPKAVAEKLAAAEMAEAKIYLEALANG
jgi:hypothetical protein